MATSSISDFSAPSVAHVTIGPRVELEEVDFEIKPSLIIIVQASTFYGKPHEDANAHLQHFLEVCGTITIKGVTTDTTCLYLFPFSLLGKRSNGFTLSPVMSIPREGMPMHFSRKSSRWVIYLL
jgi:hypothetical protein